MIANPQIPLHRLVLSLSEALDLVSPSVADHQLRVAYMSTRIAQAMGVRGQALRDIFHAAALHDIGMIRSEARVRAVAHNQLEGLGWHAKFGYELLRDNEFLADAAPIVRCHHAAWDRGVEDGIDGQPPPMGSYIVALADSVDRYTRRDVPILRQNRDIADRVFQKRGQEFCPDCVEAFRQVCQAPAFWLDATSKRIYAILSHEVNWPALTLDESAIEGIARTFGRLVDALSPWTGTHSAGVAATAVCLGERLKFSPREQLLLRAAGYLHDLGKITVPSAILDKQGKPTAEEWAILQGHTYHTFRILDSVGGMPQITEWASFHHERLDGKGYPFGHTAKDLTLGTRAMAVADTFTAITEDRPYRAGMDEAQALGILNELAAKGGLDGEVVAVLARDFDEINATRREEQSAYRVKQQTLMGIMDAESAVTSVTSG